MSVSNESSLSTSVDSTSQQSFFSQLFKPQIVTAIKAAGYKSPTPIQEQAIPHVLEGRDVLGLAQTGTGKTAAFVLPILENLISSGGRSGSALIIAPTRELADQIHETVKTLSGKVKISSAAIYGGVAMSPQVSTLRRGVNIIVACPGRLLDHIQQRTVDLRGVDTLVLDEADHMFDMGFLPTIRKILRALPQERQTLLFSATMPTEVRKLALDVLRNPITVQVTIDTPISTVSHAIYPITEQRKSAFVLRLLKDIPTGSVLVFSRTKHRAKRLAERLINEGHSATCLQGNLSQNRRREALEGFRQGSYRIMVATDIAARGIDVSSVSHVINFDIPDTVEAYTHRIGRTGRAARTGDAFTLVTGEDVAMVRDIERVLRAPLTRRKLEDFDYSNPEGGDSTFHRAGREDSRRGQGRPSGGRSSGRRFGNSGSRGNSGRSRSGRSGPARGASSDSRSPSSGFRHA